MDASLGAALTLGFMLGAAHALEPDHVAAVATPVGEQRRVRVSCLLGAFWGLGHTAALLAAGAAVIVFRVAMPPGMERGLEMSVALLSSPRRTGTSGSTASWCSSATRAPPSRAGRAIPTAGRSRLACGRSTGCRSAAT